MKITLTTASSTAKTLVIRVEQEGAAVDVYANDILLGWFDAKHEDGKLRFGSAFIADNDKEFIATDAGQLTTY